MTTALLVIDVQRALCEGQWAMFDIARIIERINGLARQARAAGVPIVFVQHEEPEDPMRHGTPGWELAPALDAQPGDLYIRKTTPDSFNGTPLHEELQRRGVKQVVVCGLQSEFCVDSTTRGALARGYPVTLVSDGHSTMDNGVLTAAQITAHHNATLGNMGSFGPRVKAMPAADIRIGA